MLLSKMMRSALLAMFVASIADLPVVSTAEEESGSKLLEEFSGMPKGDRIEERDLTGESICDNNDRGRELTNNRRKSRFTYYMEFIGINGKFGSKQKDYLEDAFVDVYNEYIGGCSDKPYQRFIHNVKVTKQCLFDNIDDTSDDTRQLELVADQNHRNLPRNRKRNYIRWDGTVSCGHACADENDPLFEDALDIRMLMHRVLKNNQQTPSGSGTCCKYNNRRILTGNKPRCRPCPLVDEFRIEFNRVLKRLVKKGKIRKYNKIGDITPEEPDIDVCNF